MIFYRNLREIMFRLKNVILEQIIFVSQGITVLTQWHSVTSLETWIFSNITVRSLHKTLSWFKQGCPLNMQSRNILAQMSLFDFNFM